MCFGVATQLLKNWFACQSSRHNNERQLVISDDDKSLVSWKAWQLAGSLREPRWKKRSATQLLAFWRQTWTEWLQLISSSEGTIAWQIFGSAMRVDAYINHQAFLSLVHYIFKPISAKELSSKYRLILPCLKVLPYIFTWSSVRRNFW